LASAEEVRQRLTELASAKDVRQLKGKHTPHDDGCPIFGKDVSIQDGRWDEQKRSQERRKLETLNPAEIPSLSCAHTIEALDKLETTCVRLIQRFAGR